MKFTHEYQFMNRRSAKIMGSDIDRLFIPVGYSMFNEHGLVKLNRQIMCNGGTSYWTVEMKTELMKTLGFKC